MKKYRAILFWEGHGHSDQDHTYELESDNLEYLKHQVARETLSGDGYNLVDIVQQFPLIQTYPSIMEDIEDIKTVLKEEQAQRKREEAQKHIELRQENKRRKKILDYILFLRLKERFESMDDEELWHLDQEAKDYER